MQTGNNDRLGHSVYNYSNLEFIMHQVMWEARRQLVFENVHRKLDADLLGVDAKWLLFGMAVQNYRYESLLLPYPPAFCTPTGYNIDALHLAMGTMPDFTTVRQKLLDGVLSMEQLDLLYWLLVESGTPHLHHLMRNEQLLLWRELGQRPLMRPQLVFRVDASNMFPYAEPLDVSACVYYCGGMEELFRLIATPQRDALNTELEFNDELEAACESAEWSPGWGYSLCGALVRCVAICQIHPDPMGSSELLYVRYLLFYNLQYSQKMLRIRRGQWRLVEQKKLRKQMQQLQNTLQVEQQQLPESDEDKSVQEESESTNGGNSLFNWLGNKLKFLAFMGVLSFAAYKLHPRT